MLGLGITLLIGVILATLGAVLILVGLITPLHTVDYDSQPGHSLTA